MKIWTRSDVERWAATAISAFREYRKIPNYGDDRAQHATLLDVSEVLAEIENDERIGGEMFFECDLKKTKKCHMACSEPVVGECEFRLTGSKAGQTCGRPVCAGHSRRKSGEPRLCLAHVRVIAKRESAK